LVDGDNETLRSFSAPAASPTTPENLLLKYGNRHGLVTGATGTGKTVTLQILAEGFSAMPACRCSAPTSRATSPASPWARPRISCSSAPRTIGFDPYEFQEFPVIFWDLFGKAGPPDPRHRLGDGAAAALAPDEPQRHRRKAC
jgi:hypothetical protein